MNAPSRPASRAQEQALSAPFLIEDEEVVRKIARIADERGTPMQEVVALAVQDYLRRLEASQNGPDWLRQLWERNPLPLPTGLKADKAFFDRLSGEA